MVVPLVMSAALAIAQEFLPSLAAKLSGRNARTVAETVVSAAAAAAGVSPTTPADQMIARIKADPVADGQLRQELQLIDREVYLAELDDRGDARRSQLERGDSARVRGNWMIIGVSAGLVACVGGIILMARGLGPDDNIPEGVLALVTTVAGALLKMLSDAFAFEFGSSRGSREKSAILETQSQELASAGARTTQTVMQAVREAQQQIPEAVAKVAAVTGAAVATGAAAATAAVESVTGPRDFVGQLVRGEI